MKTQDPGCARQIGPRVLALMLAFIIVLASAAHAATILYDDQGNELCNLPGPGTLCATVLDDLLGGYSLQAGDKLFSEWAEISRNTSGTATIDTSTVDVGAFEIGPLLQGVFIAPDQAGLGNFSAQDGGSLTYAFRYRVDVVSPSSNLIKDNTLQLDAPNIFTGVPGVIPSGMITISEKVFDESLTLLAEKLVQFDPNNITTLPVQDTKLFGPVSSVIVETEISIVSQSAGGLGLGAMSQSFSQVPVPGSLLLLGVGLAAMGFRMNDRSAVA